MYLSLLVICLSSAVALIPSKFTVCPPPIDLPSSLDLNVDSQQNVSIQLCNATFNVTLYPNNYLFARNVSFDRAIRAQHPKRRFSFVGQILDEDLSSVTLIFSPNLHIFLFSNETYFYHISLSNSSSLTLTFSQQRLIQSYPALVNDSIWNNLHQEEEIYQKRAATLRDLHFIYELLTLRCESEFEQTRSRSFCSLALFLDETLFRSTFNSNIQQIFVFIEHFNFLMRTLTQNEYGGFLIKRVALLPPPVVVVVVNNQTNGTTQTDMLHTLADAVNLSSKDYCLVHQMILATNGNRSSVIGYQASTNTYDIGGICSLPFRSSDTLDTNNESNTSEMNLNTGLSFLIANTTRNISLFFDGLMATSYLFLRQMGLNLTLCSVNDTRRRFFQLSKDFSPLVPQCSDLVPLTLHPALKRRAHLCFTHLQIDPNNSSSLIPIKQQTSSCKESIDLQSSVILGGKHRKSPYIENALNNNRHGEWFEGNIVGMALTFSLLLWIPVSCFVHFCVDETNKKALIEKQQQDIEVNISLPSKSPVVEMRSRTKHTQTD